MVLFARVQLCSVAACAALLLGLASGCVSEKQARKSVPAVEPSGPIRQINLLAVPVAWNLDSRPGPDGFVIKIYAGNPKRPKPVPIDSGSIEVRMYDGIPGVTAPADTAPRRVWTYTAAELRLYQIQSSIGPGYQLVIPWGDAKPASDKITVVVSYAPPQGAPVVSAPSIIATR